MIKARRYSTTRGASQRDVMLTEALTQEVLAKAGPRKPRGTMLAPRRPAINPQLVAVYPNAKICLECPELARITCGTGYCKLGPQPQNYLALINLIQQGSCPLGKHESKEINNAN